MSTLRSSEVLDSLRKRLRTHDSRAKSGVESHASSSSAVSSIADFIRQKEAETSVKLQANSSNQPVIQSRTVSGAGAGVGMNTNENEGTKNNNTNRTIISFNTQGSLAGGNTSLSSGGSGGNTNTKSVTGSGGQMGSSIFSTEPPTDSPANNTPLVSSSNFYVQVPDLSAFEAAWTEACRREKDGTNQRDSRQKPQYFQSQATKQQQQQQHQLQQQTMPTTSSSQHTSVSNRPSINSLSSGTQVTLIEGPLTVSIRTGGEEYTTTKVTARVVQLPGSSSFVWGSDVATLAGVDGAKLAWCSTPMWGAVPKNTVVGFYTLWEFCEAYPNSVPRLASMYGFVLMTDRVLVVAECGNESQQNNWTNALGLD